MWLIGRRAKKLADRIAEEFGATPEDTGSFLNEFPFRVKFRYREMDVNIEVHVACSHLRIEIENFKSKERLACSINEADTLSVFDVPVEKVFRKSGIAVFTSGQLGAQERAAVHRFCDSLENEHDIENLRLEKGERITVFANGILALLSGDSIELLRHRLEVISGLFSRNAAGGGVKIFCDYPYRIVVTDPRGPSAGKEYSRSRHVFGGVSRNELPTCWNCSTPVHLLARIDLDDPEISCPRIEGGVLYIVTCMNCDSYWDPLYLQCSGERLSILHQGTGRRIAGWPRFLEERDILLVRLDPSGAPDGAELPKHQLCGHPYWIQTEERPNCPKCQQEMAFIAQLDTDPAAGIRLGDDGILYAFVCSLCNVVATFAQSR